MMNYQKSILALVAACSLNISCASRLIWQVNINGAANGDDAAFAVGVDANGDVAAAGRTRNTGTGDDFTVVKLDVASGAELWRQTIHGVRSHEGRALAVTVDANGDFVAVGSSTNILADFTVVKFDGTSGGKRWYKAINGTANRHDAASRVAVDTKGDVVAAGSIANTGTGGDFAVVKFDGVAGAELWRQMINGKINGEDAVSAVAVDAQGNVVAVGSTWNTPKLPVTDFTVAKFDGSSGTEVWRKIIPGTSRGSSGATAVAVDGVGDVLAAGYTVVADLAVIKFDAGSGTELWRQAINGTANTADFATAITVNINGDVVVAGFIANAGTGNDFAVLKFDGVTGRELWRQVINGTANDDDRALAVSVDLSGDVVAAGYVTSTGTGNDFTVVKFDGVTGRELWRQMIDGTANGHDFAYAVIVDAAGDVIAAGVTRNTSTGGDFTVVKLKGN